MQNNFTQMFLIDIIYDTPCFCYQSSSNDFILLNKSASSAKNLGEQSRTFMALLYCDFIRLLHCYPSILSGVMMHKVTGFKVL